MKQLSNGFGMQPCRFRRALLAGLLLLPLVLADRGFALDPDRSLQQYNLQTWSRQNGLPATGITAITQTRDGYLWLGTSKGLVRFDGTDFKLLDISSVTNLSSSIVTSLAGARNGGLWAGLESSAFGFCDGQSFSFRGQTNWGGLGMNVRSIVESEDGTLWFAAAESGAARLTRSGAFEQLTTSDSSTNGALNALCCYEDRQGRLWFGTAERGLYYWQAGKLTRVADSALDAALIFSIAGDHKGQIWVGTGDGLHCLDSNLRPKATFPLDAEVRALLVDDHDVLWIGTAGNGLGRFRDGALEFIRRADGLGSEYVNALAEDHEGSLWIGTRGGVSQLTDLKFPTQPAAVNLSVRDALSVAASHQGGVWIGSPRGVTYFDPASGMRKTYGSEMGIPDRYIKRVFEASNGDLYLVCYLRSLAILSPEKKLLAVHTNSDLIVGMAEDARGVVVSVAGDLYRAGTNYFQPYAFTNAEKPPMYWILNLASGRDGVIWVACGGGIFRVKDGAYQQWSAAEGLSTEVLWICEDNEGVVWGATLKGIVRLKNNRISVIDREHGLFDNNIYAVVPDDFGNLWVDSGRGIFSVSRQSVNDFADGKTARVQCTVYDGMDSVKLADKTSQQERVACKTSDGRIWFPEANGVVMIDPAHIPTNRVAPQVHIDLFKADGREVARGEAVTVPPGKGELEFNFDASTYIAPQKARFRYRLEGYDDDWVDAGSRRLAFYTNLKPGAYTFQVIAANADGVWNEKGDTMAISLRPHYYETAWFRLLCGGLAFATLIGIYLLRVQRLNLQQQALQKNRDLLESEVERRTAELAKTNAVLQEKIAEHKRAEMALLESQALHQSLVTQMPVGLFRKDREGRFVAVNPVFCQLKGLSAEEILGKTPRELDDYECARENAGLLKQPPRQRMLAAQGEEHHKQIMRTGETIEVEEAYPQPDGTVEYFQVVKTPVFDALGLIIGSQGVQFDITDRRQAEQKLAESRNFLDRIINTVPDPIFVKDRQHRGVLVNDAFCQLMRLKREELLGKTDHNHDCLTPAQADEFRSKDELVFTTGKENINEETITAADGTVRSIITKKALYTGEKGEKFIVGVSRDITERKQAEEKLMLFRALIEGSNDAIHVVDPATGRFLDVNESACRALGYTRDEHLALTVFDVVEIEREYFHATVERAKKEGHATVEVLHRRKDGTRFPVEVSLSPVTIDREYLLAVVRDITERKQAEVALNYERDLLRTLLDNSPDNIYFKDTQSRFVKASKSQARVFGVASPDEMTGKTDFDFFDEAHARPAFEDEQNIIRTGLPMIGKEELEVWKDGHVTWVSSTKMPWFDRTGKIIGIIGVSRDITSQKLGEKQVRQLSSAVEHSPASIVITDPAGNIEYVNPKFTESSGYSAEEVVGKTPRFLKSGDTPVAEYKQMWQTILSGREWQGEFHNRKKNGELYWESASISSIMDDAGKISHFVAVKEDITERKRARQQLNEALNFNRAIISDAAVGITVFKASGQCVLANETAARTLKATVPQLLALDFRQIASWRASGMLQIAEEVLATKEPRQCELHFVSSFGADVWLESRFSHFIQNGEPHFIHVFVDVTEKKKMEAQLLRSQRMESIGTLAGGIAHDLNNVLAPLLISVQLLKEKVSDDAGRRLLDSLEANVNRGASLVKQVLTFGRGIKGERITIHLKHIGDGIARMIRETFPKSLKFEIQCADGLWTVTGDPTQLEQVLMNLCVNARDAMPGGGTLSIRMENRVLDKDHTTANLEAKPGSYVVISVSDTGTGMAPEIRDRIFEPFFTTKEQGKGTGLGLSTALAIVKSHSGFINCYSEVGKGSVFKVYLPASPDAANVKPAAANQSRLPRGNNELVLVVDDEEPIRVLAKFILERFGYRVLLAADGTEAVKLYTSRRNEIAAVITDMSMPGMDGPATIAALRGINPEVKVIGSSGLDVRDGATGVVNAGLIHFMSKPYTAETVLNMLHEILRENPAK